MCEWDGEAVNDNLDLESEYWKLLQAFPTMPGTVIAERVGWDRSIRVLRDRVAELRPIYLPPDPASRTQYLAGEIAQFDLWFPRGLPGRRLLVPATTP